jgi:hypothetical protein
MCGAERPVRQSVAHFNTTDSRAPTHRLHERAGEILSERREKWAGKGTLEALPPKTVLPGPTSTKKRPLLTNGVPFPDGGNAPPMKEKVT